MATDNALDGTERLLLAEWINGAGAPAVREQTGLTAESLCRLAAGLPVRRSTLVVARAAIANHGQAPASRTAPPWLVAELRAIVAAENPRVQLAALADRLAEATAVRVTARSKA